jgi:hypothetical protein
MSGVRIIAVLVAIAVMAVAQYGLATAWYVALLLGVLVYLLARYVGGAIVERRRFKREWAEMIDSMKGPPP